MNSIDDIMIFKEKHIKISDSEIKDLLQNQMKLIDHIKNKQNQDVSGNLLYYCNKITFCFLYTEVVTFSFPEDKVKIIDLTSKVNSSREILQSEKQTLEYKNNVLSKHLNHIVIIFIFLFSYKYNCSFVL